MESRPPYQLLPSSFGKPFGYFSDQIRNPYEILMTFPIHNSMIPTKMCYRNVNRMGRKICGTKSNIRCILVILVSFLAFTIMGETIPTEIEGTFRFEYYGTKYHLEVPIRCIKMTYESPRRPRLTN